MLHLPVLRAGHAYRSLDSVELGHVRTGEPVARISLANRGLIARDLRDAPSLRRTMQQLPVRDLLAICKKAAELFAGGEIVVDPIDGVRHGPDEYVRTLSETTGMPHALVRMNMEKIRFVLAEMETVLAGLTRGLDLSVLDSGWSVQEGRSVSYVGEADNLGVLLPSNSPGVHSLWIPAIPLKTPIVLKPGTREPWTPMRIVQSLVEAGCPPAPLGYYPTDYSGCTEILLRTDRSMFFGDASTVSGWRNDSSVQIHGPGWSKVLLGRDIADDWERHVELMAISIAENGGRSCLNASGVWVPAHGREIAEAVASRLVKIDARELDDPEARLAAFPEAGMAQRISDYIDQQLEIPGAEDVTARLRGTGRVVQVDGCTFLLPTLVRCDDPDHPLLRSEFLFPFATVVETPQREMLRRIGPTLVGTALTEDSGFTPELLAARNIDRLNLGAFPTSRVSWDQPHEGNLFEHLYRQRALQAANG